MKLAISNIGWSVENDLVVYQIMREYGYAGLEIAPTRIFPDNPYENLVKAENWARELKEEIGLVVTSMQSIWFGRQEKMFGTTEERRALLEYTKKAIDFADVIRCRNLVFGCPKNRFFCDSADWQNGIEFFREIGNYAYTKGTAIGMEANPPIYNTNYINNTKTAIDLIKEVDSKGFLLNLDVGTMIENGENVDFLRGYVTLINHVHISEPNLKPIQKRNLHTELAQLLRESNYSNYVSIEMGKVDELSMIESALSYVKEVFS